MRLFIIILLSCIVTCSNGQQALYIKVSDKESKLPVQANVLIKKTNKGFLIDTTGIALFPFSSGSYTLITSASGYTEQETHVTLPYPYDILEIELARNEEELEEIIIQSTRTSRSIANVPSRVETIALEEIDEKSNMRPANVAMILHESTGIQVQQTSATSANAGIRIQGLDGKYTQLLKDGFANFGNFASGLSVLEIPPLDLKQVEIIKGPSSTLYGGGAIAGVINFISKTPGAKPVRNFILNHSNIGQSNIGGFFSARERKAGYTLLALYNRQNAYDVDGDEFTEVPLSNEFTLHPRLFLYPDKTTTITIGHSFTKAERTGGDIQVIRNKPSDSHQYFEKNSTSRNITTFELEKRSSDKRRFIAKQSFSVFDRSITLPSYTFAGVDHSAYTDISYITNGGKHALVTGANFIFSSFREKDNTGRNNTVRTAGLYAQHTLDASDKIKVESGLRLDFANYKNSLYSNSELFVLPRISALFTFSRDWSSRIGGGIGYKTPTLFTQETETIQYRNVAQLNNVRSEKSYGGTADINFRTRITSRLAFTFNHMFFYTAIARPLYLQTNAAGSSFINASRPLHTKGFETNARLSYKNEVKLFLGYTFTDARARYLMGNQFLPLVPKHKLNTALIYEKEDVIKIGLEGYFTGKQHLSNGGSAPAFKELGFMVEKIFKAFSLYVNFENFTDTRQSRYKNVVNGSHLNPVFDEIWTHTEGFVINGGVKLKL